MIWRVRFIIGGGHVHCTLYTAKSPNQTFAKCGDFVVSKGDEFKSLLEAFSGADFIGNGSGTGEGIAEACTP